MHVYIYVVYVCRSYTYIASPIFLFSKTGLLLHPELANSVRLASQQVLGFPPVLVSPALGWQCHSQLFTWVLGIHTQVLCFHHKCFPNWAFSPAPTLYFGFFFVPLRFGPIRSSTELYLQLLIWRHEFLSSYLCQPRLSCEMALLHKDRHFLSFHCMLLTH